MKFMGFLPLTGELQNGNHMEGLQGLEGMKVQYVLEIGQYQMLIFVSNAYSIDKTDRTIIIDHNRSM